MLFMIAERPCTIDEHKDEEVPRVDVRRQKCTLRPWQPSFKFGSVYFPTVERPKDRGVPVLARSACQLIIFVLSLHYKCLSLSPFLHPGRFVFFFLSFRSII